MEKILTALSGLIKAVTIQRVTLTVALLAAMLALSVVYEGRGHIVESVFINKQSAGHEILEDLSPSSKEAINAFMNKHPEVALLSVVAIDLKRNQRVVVMRRFNDRALERNILAAEATKDYDNLPVFMTDDVSNNNQMISLINGEYSCAATDKGGLAMTFPEKTKDLTISCRAPIPPAWSVGTVGYVSAHLHKEEDRASMDRLKLDLMTLALYLYGNESSKGL